MAKLYLVPTPIGNLKDITLRALEVLENADLIAAEDTRQSLKLLNHFNIKKPLISYHKYNEKEKSCNLLDRILNGENVALVTDAGTPGISDPGSVIVQKCIENNIEFEVLPGATAFTTALVYSGLDTTKFLFRGFLPRTKKERNEVVKELVDRRETIILYEAPHRVLDTLSFILDSFGNRQISACRELTKLHEEIVRGTCEEVISFFENKAPRGEFVFVVSGKSDDEIQAEKKSEWEHLSIKDHILVLLDKGMTKKEAIKEVAKQRQIAKSEVYKHSLDI